ncbi:acetyltransferase (GNAT) family protein [Micromonospora pisi]|uniref:Acetyltransferase (GNAT) family protein n=1 Tax=Micromonospora pisi TaxID=589240 RepID=A0A495JSQ7_9ACTN|nr:GNAT family N-acetyltransferase [Micromonospora pisi]RKR92003.1 acetyltransferase (GNAT) family protein [Micromonospora pisi]
MDREQLGRLAELAEAEFMLQYVAGAPQTASSALGVSHERIGGGVALSLLRAPTPYWNKALGFGFEEPVTRDLMDRVFGFYREQGTEVATIQIAPDRLPRDWDEIRAAEGLEPGGVIIQFACEIDSFRIDGATDLRIGLVPSDDAAQWASVLMDGFGWPPGGPLAELLAATVGNPSFRAFGAWDGDQVVGAAALFVHDEVAVLSGAATRPSHRGRGVQSALMAIRAGAAAEAGCRWVVAQTGRPATGSVNHSLNNMLRGGLRPLYDRQNWIRRAAPGGQ